MKNKIKVFGVSIIIFLVMSVSVVSVFSKEETDSIYSKLKLFTEIFTLIKNNYVDEVEVQKLVYGAAKGMVSVLDPFSQFLSPSAYKDIEVQTKGTFGGLGIRISIKEDWIVVITPLPGTPAYRQGILPGDKIVKIEGKSTKGFSVDDAINKLRGKPGTNIAITIVREEEEKELEFNIKREFIEIESVVGELFDDGIGYIRIAEFNAKTQSDFDRALSELEKQNIKSLILDLRNNPGGLLTSAVDVCKKFIGENKLLVYTEGRNKSETIEYKADEKAQHPYLSLIVLVNKGSASGAEIVAGAVKDLKRGVILGEQTFGKGSVQTIMHLSDGAGLRLTTAKYYTPSGVCIHDVGITPDIVIKIQNEEMKKIMQSYDKIYNNKKKDKDKSIVKEKVIDLQLEYAISMLKAREIFLEAENK